MTVIWIKKSSNPLLSAQKLLEEFSPHSKGNFKFKTSYLDYRVDRLSIFPCWSITPIHEPFVVFRAFSIAFEVTPAK